jgi:UDP-N-acetylglucosamine 2-epimerase (non-hydrolysing)
MSGFGLGSLFEAAGRDVSGKLRTDGVHIIDPLGYLDFLQLMMNCKFVMTDSGGIQEETTALNVPCLTIRSTTERPITVNEGTNVLVGSDTRRIVDEALKIIDIGGKKGGCPMFWDGRAAERIVSILSERLGGKSRTHETGRAQ